MKKISTLSILIGLLFLMANCGSTETQDLSYLDESRVQTSSITSIHYQYSLEVDRNAYWSRSSGFSEATSCSDEWYLKIMTLLESATVEPGRLSSGTFHTMDTPFHQLTVTYSDGNSQSYKLHIPSSYETDLTLSNTEEIVAYYNSYFQNPSACPE